MFGRLPASTQRRVVGCIHAGGCVCTHRTRTPRVRTWTQRRGSGVHEMHVALVVWVPDPEQDSKNRARSSSVGFRADPNIFILRGAARTESKRARAGRLRFRLTKIESARSHNRYELPAPSVLSGYVRGIGGRVTPPPVTRRLTACVIAGCVGHASVHCDSGPRAWGSGERARCALCVSQQQQHAIGLR